MNSELANLGRTNLVRYCEKFFQKIALARRAQAIAKKRQKELAAAIEAEMEILLDNIASLTGFNRDDPRVLAAAIQYTLEHTAAKIDARERAENGYVSCIGEFGDL